MKKAIILIIALIILVIFVFPLSNSDIEADKAAIKQAALNYIEGWYEGNAERMAKALHPDLNKRGIQVIPQTQRTILPFASASMMVEYTRAGFGKNPEKKQKVKIMIFVVFKNTASAKAVSPDFIDHIHLAKCNGEWKIINVLWEPNK